MLSNEKDCLYIFYYRVYSVGMGAVIFQVIVSFLYVLKNKNKCNSIEWKSVLFKYIFSIKKYCHLKAF